MGRVQAADRSMDTAALARAARWRPLRWRAGAEPWRHRRTLSLRATRTVVDERRRNSGTGPLAAAPPCLARTALALRSTGDGRRRAGKVRLSRGAAAGAAARDV